MKSAVALHRLLGDEARLRLLRVLAAERLNVTELTAVLGLAQSGVSRHLGLLKDAGLVVEERDGGYSYYRIAPAVLARRPVRRSASREGGSLGAGGREGQDGFGPLWALLEAEFADAAGDPDVRADEARLQEVLRIRQENFETHGAERQLEPGRSWAAWARALGHLLPPLDVADLGCGEGYLTIEAARWARRVIAIDRSPEVLRRARALARRRRATNIVWKPGEIEGVPLPDASVDVALLSQALHHAEAPAQAIAEAVRILRPGGRVLVLDLRPHDQAWVRERIGDRWLGFDEEPIARWLKAAGLKKVRVQVGSRRRGNPFKVLIASGTK